MENGVRLRGEAHISPLPARERFESELLPNLIHAALGAVPDGMLEFLFLDGFHKDDVDKKVLDWVPTLTLFGGSGLCVRCAPVVKLGAEAPFDVKQMEPR